MNCLYSFEDGIGVMMRDCPKFWHLASDRPLSRLDSGQNKLVQMGVSLSITCIAANVAFSWNLLHKTTKY